MLARKSVRNCKKTMMDVLLTSIFPSKLHFFRLTCFLAQFQMNNHRLGSELSILWSRDKSWIWWMWLEHWHSKVMLWMSILKISFMPLHFFAFEDSQKRKHETICRKNNNTTAVATTFLLLMACYCIMMLLLLRIKISDLRKNNSCMCSSHKYMLNGEKIETKKILSTCR